MTNLSQAPELKFNPKKPDFFNPYKMGLEILCAAGIVKPKGNRVLLKAILGMEGSILLQAKENTLRAVCHEVVAIGPDVLDTWVGDQVLHISTAADAADYDKFEKNEAKYVFVREEDLVGGWDFDEAVEVVKSIPGNEKTGQ